MGIKINHKWINNKEHKLCPNCGIYKEIYLYTKRNINPDGLYCYCKECKSNKEREHRINNIENIKTKSKEKISTTQYKKYKSEYDKRYRKETIKWKVKHKEYQKSEKYRQYGVGYRQTQNYKISRTLCNQKRRLTTNNTCDNTITKESLKKLYEYQGKKCKICGIKLEGLMCPNQKNRTGRELDHILPISKGGKHSIFNAQWLCRKCNRIKNANIIDKQISLF